MPAVPATPPDCENVFTCLPVLAPGLISVPLKLSPCTVQPDGITNGKISLYTPFLMYKTSPTETEVVLKVIFDEALGEPTPVIVIS